jgi:hypothetical protein
MPKQNTPAASNLMRVTGLTWPQLVSCIAQDGYDIAGHWELITLLGMSFHRCIVFDSSQFHARTSRFGSNIDTARLTQNFFFDSVSLADLNRPSATWQLQGVTYV